MFFGPGMVRAEWIAGWIGNGGRRCRIGIDSRGDDDDSFASLGLEFVG